MASDYKANMGFEAEVRRVAEAIWQLEPGQCQPVHYSTNSAVREVDGMAQLRDVTHLLMVTVSKKLEKATSDIKKLDAAAIAESYRGVPVSKWLITKDQLDAEHITYARKHNVTVLTLDNFRNRFFNGREYLNKRRKAAFGSARNLGDGRVTIAENEYVELPMTLEILQPGYSNKSELQRRDVNITKVSERLINGGIVIMTAPFGSGKSLTTREIFLRLTSQYIKNEVSVVPVVINLREHWGQDYGDEILERHARSIGFSPKEDLTIAWRAGIVTLLIDGFDEVASQVVARSDQADFMRQARSQALRGTRDLIRMMPSSVGVLVCGRDHYFDDIGEMTRALDITGKTFSLVRLGEFTEEQAGQFLSKNGISHQLPDWLPRKPLILGYLAHRGLLEDILKIDSSQGFGYAWTEFLRLICEREATLERAIMDPQTVQNVLERLACGVRATLSGTGPITERELADAYRHETGQIAGEGVLTQLQRLPGLTEREQDPGARSFIDEDILAALQGSAISRFVLGDVRGLGDKAWLDKLSGKATTMASYLLRRAGADAATIISTTLRAVNNDGNFGRDRQIAADSLMIAAEIAKGSGHLDCGALFLEGVSLGVIDLEEMSIDNLTLVDCIISEVVLGPCGAGSALIFQKCSIQRVSGIASAQGLPSMFVDCSIEEYDDMSTNNAVLRSSLPDSVKALATILRKLYLQAGGGRKVNALKRGIPSGSVLEAVDEILQILERENVVAITNEVAHPIRRQTSRVIQILSAPNLSNDPIVVKVTVYPKSVEPAW